MPQRTSNHRTMKDFSPERGTRRGAQGNRMAQLRTSFGTLAGRRARSRRPCCCPAAPTASTSTARCSTMMGISPAAQEARKFEPQVGRARPPGHAARRQAGSRSRAPGRRRRAKWRGRTTPSSASCARPQERERLHLAYCRGDVQWKERVLNKDAVDTPRSPYGPCPTIFGGVSVNGVNSINEERIGRRCGVLTAAHRGSEPPTEPHGNGPPDRAAPQPRLPYRPTLICCHLTSLPGRPTTAAGVLTSRPTRKGRLKGEAAAPSLVVRNSNPCRNQAIAALPPPPHSHSPSQCSRKPSKR